MCHRPSIRVSAGSHELTVVRQRELSRRQDVHAGEHVLAGDGVPHVDAGEGKVAPGAHQQDEPVVIDDDLAGVVAEHDAVAREEQRRDLLQLRRIGEVERPHSPVGLLEEAEAGVGHRQVELAVADVGPAVGVLHDVRVAHARLAEVAGPHPAQPRRAAAAVRVAEFAQHRRVAQVDPRPDLVAPGQQRPPAAAGVGQHRHGVFVDHHGEAERSRQARRRCLDDGGAARGGDFDAGLPGHGVVRAEHRNAVPGQPGDHGSAGVAHVDGHGPVGRLRPDPGLDEGAGPRRGVDLDELRGDQGEGPELFGHGELQGERVGAGGFGGPAEQARGRPGHPQRGEGAQYVTSIEVGHLDLLVGTDRTAQFATWHATLQPARPPGAGHAGRAFRQREDSG